MLLDILLLLDFRDQPGLCCCQRGTSGLVRSLLLLADKRRDGEPNRERVPVAGCGRHQSQRLQPSYEQYC